MKGTRGLGSGGQSGGGESFGKLSEHHCHVIEPAGLTLIADEAERRCLGRRHPYRPARRIEALNRHARDAGACEERDTDRSALNRAAVLGEEDLESLRALMRRTVILRRRQEPRIVA